MATEPTAKPDVDALPVAPTRNSPTTFRARMDAFLAAMVTFRTQIVALAAWIVSTAQEVYDNAGEAATSASTATTQAGIATTKAGEAATSATEAEGYKDNAQTAAAAAGAAAGLPSLTGNAGKALLVNPAADGVLWETTAALLASIRDEKASGTGGGASTTSYSTRDLNTAEYDPNSLITISSNTFSCAVACVVTWSAPGYRCNDNKTRLVRVSDDAVISIGTSEAAPQTGNGGSRSFGAALIAADTAYRIEHRADTNHAATGFGQFANYGDAEVYTIVNFWGA